MKNEKKEDTFVTLKSALKKATLSAVLAGGLLDTTVQASDIAVAQQPLDQRVKAVGELLRKKMSENQSPVGSARAENSTDTYSSPGWNNGPTE